MANIVVIDDDPGIRLVITAILQCYGHSVVAFENGKKGIGHITEQASDLLITDIFMPEMDGLETVKIVRALDPEMPIIVVSGGGSRGDMRYLAFADRFGANATLEKPFRPSDLLDLVTALLPASQNCE